MFLHGWSSCRRECDPLPELLAKSLDANLYYGRLSGHGRRHRRGRLGGGGPDGDALAEEAEPGALFQDALDAVRGTTPTKALWLPRLIMYTVLNTNEYSLP